MRAAFFDLDDTLMAGDTDTLWGEFLAALGVVDRAAHRARNLRFSRDYDDGALDIVAYTRFQLEVLTRHPPAEVERWRDRFVREHIVPIVLPKARDLLAHHARAGHERVVVTATNRFVTQPIAALLDADELIATEPERIDGRYTGDVAGVPSFAHGKVVRVQEWIDARGEPLEESWFYSDSHNDLPLLSRVTHPVAVDPDPRLRAAAQENDWEIISLR